MAFPTQWQVTDVAWLAARVVLKRSSIFTVKYQLEACTLQVPSTSSLPTAALFFCCLYFSERNILANCKSSNSEAEKPWVQRNFHFLQRNGVAVPTAWKITNIHRMLQESRVKAKIRCLHAPFDSCSLCASPVMYAAHFLWILSPSMTARFCLVVNYYELAATPTYLATHYSPRGHIARANNNYYYITRR